MPDEKQDDSKFPLEFEVQSDEVRKNILAGAPAGLGTATGKERARLFDNADDDIPSGEDAGSKVPIAGGDSIRPDAEGPSEGAAGQLQPAIMTTNGSVPLGFVGTPSGPQPIGALVSHQNRRMLASVSKRRVFRADRLSTKASREFRVHRSNLLPPRGCVLQLMIAAGTLVRADHGFLVLASSQSRTKCSGRRRATRHQPPVLLPRLLLANRS